VRWVRLADLSTQPLLPKVAERITDLIALPPRVDLFCVAV
jgi:hypothetical protein